MISGQLIYILSCPFKRILFLFFISFSPHPRPYTGAHNAYHKKEFNFPFLILTTYYTISSEIYHCRIYAVKCLPVQARQPLAGLIAQKHRTAQGTLPLCPACIFIFCKYLCRFPQDLCRFLAGSSALQMFLSFQIFILSRKQIIAQKLLLNIFESEPCNSIGKSLTCDSLLAEQQDCFSTISSTSSLSVNTLSRYLP